MPDRDDRDYDQNPEMWPDSGTGDRGGAARRKLLDYEGGYGGGRIRAEQWPEHGFGDRGWGGGRSSIHDAKTASDRRDRDLPRGAEPVHDGPHWQERYSRQNSDKYGQWGGKPIAQRGSGQSMGGMEHREDSLGSTRDLSARGGYGIRETENWPGPEQASGPHAGRGPRNYRRCDDRVCEDVCQRLTDDPEVDASDIEVVVQEGEVTLSGTVPDRYMKRAAEDAIAEVSGVRDVHNQIRIQSGPQSGL
jgi:osmotically-inducible protein OsmY